MSDDRNEVEQSDEPVEKIVERVSNETEEAKSSEARPDAGSGDEDDEKAAKSKSKSKSKDDAEDDDGSDDEPEFGKDPDKPMNDAQRKYLEPLTESQDAKLREDMTEAEAAAKIDNLQENAVHVY